MRVRSYLALAGALTASCIALVGCGRQGAEYQKDSAGTSSQTTVPPSAADTAAAPAAQERTYTFKGTVTNIDRERNRLTLDHEKIDGWMEAMTMPYPVADPAMFDQVQEQKSYTFTVVVLPDESYTLTSVKP